MKVYKVPTGHICTMEGEKGLPLEFLSIGDYGKEQNLKADFMGLTRKIEGVPNGKLLPLEEKWVITISTQYGCSMGCTFCDVPKVGPGINVTYNDLIDQVMAALSLHPEVKTAKRINLHYARMGEPTYNYDIIEATYWLAKYFKNKGWGFHPVISTIMPKKNPNTQRFIDHWMRLKSELDGEAGLQISMNTTDMGLEKSMMPNTMRQEHKRDIIYDVIHKYGLKGRKITLNFAVTDAEIDAKDLIKRFPPKWCLCKLTPMHKTKACIETGLLTDGGYDHYYPYEKIEEELKAEGYDVIVFIPSKEEDESRITCGNAILADIPPEAK